MSLLDLRSLLEGGIAAAGATTQAAQTSAGIGVETFRAVGVTSQAVQSTAGTGAETLRAVGTTTQAVQSTAGVAVETFRVVGSTAQATQSTAGAGKEALRAVGATSQAAQSTDAAGQSQGEAPQVISVPRHGARIVGVAKPVRFRRQRVAGQAATVQQPQRMAARGDVADDEEWLLFGLELAA